MKSLDVIAAPLGPNMFSTLWIIITGDRVPLPSTGSYSECTSWASMYEDYSDDDQTLKEFKMEAAFLGFTAIEIDVKETQVSQPTPQEELYVPV